MLMTGAVLLLSYSAALPAGSTGLSVAPPHCCQEWQRSRRLERIVYDEDSRRFAGLLKPAFNPDR